MVKKFTRNNKDLSNKLDKRNPFKKPNPVLDPLKETVIPVVTTTFNINTLQKEEIVKKFTFSKSSTVFLKEFQTLVGDVADPKYFNIPDYLLQLRRIIFNSDILNEKTINSTVNLLYLLIYNSSIVSISENELSSLRRKSFKIVYFVHLLEKLNTLCSLHDIGEMNTLRPIYNALLDRVDTSFVYSTSLVDTKKIKELNATLTKVESGLWRSLSIFMSYPQLLK